MVQNIPKKVQSAMLYVYNQGMSYLTMFHLSVNNLSNFVRLFFNVFIRININFKNFFFVFSC